MTDDAPRESRNEWTSQGVSDLLEQLPKDVVTVLILNPTEVLCSVITFTSENPGMVYRFVLGIYV